MSKKLKGMDFSKTKDERLFELLFIFGDEDRERGRLGFCIKNNIDLYELEHCLGVLLRLIQQDIEEQEKESEEQNGK